MKLTAASNLVLDVILFDFGPKSYRFDCLLCSLFSAFSGSTALKQWLDSGPSQGTRSDATAFCWPTWAPAEML